MTLWEIWPRLLVRSLNLVDILVNTKFQHLKINTEPQIKVFLINTDVNRVNLLSRTPSVEAPSIFRITEIVGSLNSF